MARTGLATALEATTYWILPRVHITAIDRCPPNEARASQAAGDVTHGWALTNRISTNIGAEIGEGFRASHREQGVIAAVSRAEPETLTDPRLGNLVPRGRREDVCEYYPQRADNDAVSRR